MKLQLSLDLVDFDTALKFIEETRKSIDIIEIGTPFALKYGISPVVEFKKRYSEKKILADYKIIDGGFYEADIAFEAGADIVTILGLSADATISGAVSAARKHKKEVMVDLIGLENIEKRIPALESLGVDYICVHTAIDVQSEGNNPLQDLQIARQTATKSKIAVAGGLNINNINKVIPFKPDIVVVGAGITASQDRARAAGDIKQVLAE